MKEAKKWRKECFLFPFFWEKKMDEKDGKRNYLRLPKERYLDIQECVMSH